jgi:hypothetical protein
MFKQRVSTRSFDTPRKYFKLSNPLPKIIGIVFVSLLLSLGMQSAAFAVLAAIEQAGQVGDSFRETYPFHLQVVGLTSPLKDQSRVLIISEPPPHISPEYFQSIVDSIGGEAFTRTNRIGYDGWVKDAVLALPPLSEDKLAFLLTRLHRDLYGTSYKANAVQLPIKPPPANNRSLDLSVSVGDLNNWLNNKELKFTPTIGGTARPISEILSTKQSGVFISNQRGLVVWSIPRNQDLAKYRAEARQFFLDSDLIVGAIANNHQLVIVARERTESLLRLPPLRFETALTLAAERSDELGQSYERNQLFAGNLSDTTDWAPIYLSNSLIDTEFGSLLNITDQVLKSWSMNGDIQYVNFSKYPKPQRFPQFPQAIRVLIKKAGAFLFNWNTAGVGYTTPIQPYEFYALNKTGSLPITYGAKSESVKAYEEIAYNYFSELDNPDLARVVQYTALYQIFRQFSIGTKELSIQKSPSSGAKVLEVEANLVLEKILVMSPNEYSKKLQNTLGRFNLSRQTEDTLRDSFENLYKLINQGKSRWGMSAIHTLSKMIAAPRTFSLKNNDPNFKKWLFSSYEVVATYPEILHELLEVDIENLKERYVKGFDTNSNDWIKTPSIVLSKDVGSNAIIGGHNLDSTLTQLQSSSNVSIGKVRLVKGRGTEPVILYNPNDLSRIHPLVRRLATERITTNDVKSITNSLEKALRETPSSRPLAQALDLPSTYPTKIRGLPPALKPPTANPPLGWGLRDKPLTPDEIQRLLAGDQLSPRSIIIERSPNGFAVLRSGTNQVVEARTITSFYDEVLPQFMRSIPDGDPPIKIYLNGFTPDEAQALTLTTSLRQKAQQVSFREGSNFPENVALLNRPYNWDGAIIKEVKIDRFSDGSASGYRGIIDIEIPSVISTRPSLRMRIVTSLKKLSKKVADQIAAIVQKVLSRSTPQTRTVNQIAFDIHKELRKEFPDIDLGVQIEAGDIYITQPVRSDHLARR